MNFYAILVAAVANMVVGFMWYNPKTFGNAWMKEASLSEEQIKGTNMFMLFGLSFIFAMMLAMAMHPMTMHQMHLSSLAANQLDSTDEAVKLLAQADIDAFAAKYGNEFKTFKHGALHGFLSALFVAFPIIAMNGLYERKTWKYIFIHVGYWVLSMTVMGGIVCGWNF